MRLSDQPAEARPTTRVLDQQGDVDGTGEPPPGVDGQLRTYDRPDPDPRAGVCELHRPADVVVVGEPQRLVAEIRCRGRQLSRVGGAVEEGVGRVAVQLDVAHQCRPQSRCRNQRPDLGSQKTTTSLPSSSTSSK